MFGEFLESDEEDEDDEEDDTPQFEFEGDLQIVPMAMKKKMKKNDLERIPNMPMGVPPMALKNKNGKGGLAKIPIAMKKRGDEKEDEEDNIEYEEVAVYRGTFTLPMTLKFDEKNGINSVDGGLFRHKIALRGGAITKSDSDNKDDDDGSSPIMKLRINEKIVRISRDKDTIIDSSDNDGSITFELDADTFVVDSIFARLVDNKGKYIQGCDWYVIEMTALAGKRLQRAAIKGQEPKIFSKDCDEQDKQDFLNSLVEIGRMYENVQLITPLTDDVDVSTFSASFDDYDELTYETDSEDEEDEEDEDETARRTPPRKGKTAKTTGKKKQQPVEKIIDKVKGVQSPKTSKTTKTTKASKTPNTKTKGKTSEDGGEFVETESTIIGGKASPKTTKIFKGATKTIKSGLKKTKKTVSKSTKKPKDIVNIAKPLPKAHKITLKPLSNTVKKATKNTKSTKNTVNKVTKPAIKKTQDAIIDPVSQEVKKGSKVAGKHIVNGVNVAVKTVSNVAQDQWKIVKKGFVKSADSVSSGFQNLYKIMKNLIKEGVGIIENGINELIKYIANIFGFTKIGKMAKIIRVTTNDIVSSWVQNGLEYVVKGLNQVEPLMNKLFDKYIGIKDNISDKEYDDAVSKYFKGGIKMVNKGMSKKMRYISNNYVLKEIEKIAKRGGDNGGIFGSTSKLWKVIGEKLWKIKDNLFERAGNIFNKIVNGTADLIEDFVNNNGKINIKKMFYTFVIVLKTIINEIIGLIVDIIKAVIEAVISVEFKDWFPKVASNAIKSLFKLLFGKHIDKNNITAFDVCSVIGAIGMAFVPNGWKILEMIEKVTSDEPELTSKKNNKTKNTKTTKSNKNSSKTKDTTTRRKNGTNDTNEREFEFFDTDQIKMSGKKEPSTTKSGRGGNDNLSVAERRISSGSFKAIFSMFAMSNTILKSLDTDSKLKGKKDIDDGSGPPVMKLFGIVATTFNIFAAGFGLKTSRLALDGPGKKDAWFPIIAVSTLCVNGVVSILSLTSFKYDKYFKRGSIICSIFRNLLGCILASVRAENRKLYTSNERSFHRLIAAATGLRVVHLIVDLKLAFGIKTPNAIGPLLAVGFASGVSAFGCWTGYADKANKARSEKSSEHEDVV